MIRLEPINDAPYSSNDILTIKEEESYTFSKNDFIYNDVENDSLAGLKFVELATKGVLKYDGASVELGLDYPDLTKLVYTPLPDETGSPYSQFKFRLQDSQKAY